MQFAILYAAIVGIYIALNANVLNRLKIDTASMREDLQYAQLQRVEAGVIAFLEEFSAPPTSLANMVAVDGYEYLSEDVDDFMRYSTSVQTDDDYTYTRYLIWHKKDDRYMADSVVLEDNVYTDADAAATFSDAGDYAPVADVYYSTGDTRSLISYHVSYALSQLDETTQRLLYTDDNQTVAVVDSGTLADGDSVTLREAVGYTGTQTACNAIWQLEGAPVNCQDLYTLDGATVTYQRVDDTEFLLFVELTHLDSAGDNIIVLVDGGFSEP